MRTWYYTLHPAAYEITCEKCNGSNLWWSEYKSHIWCYDCEIDFDPGDGEHAGIFSGPFPIHITSMMGLIWDRFNMETKKIEILNLDTGEYVEYDEFFETIVAKSLLIDDSSYDVYGFKAMYEARKNFSSSLYDLVDKIRSRYGEINGCT